MPLLELWESNAEAISRLSIEQVMATAGDGRLRDESDCSRELRQYFSQVSTDRLAEYVDHCLTKSFPKSGLILQDIINEFGRRLEYQAINGRYQGTPNAIGFDGIWTGPEPSSVVIEVKTTDTYRISLETIANYRDKLQATGKIGSRASILIVVGREDTGELEAQVRGSRHAWDIRLISVDALLSLVRIKESTDSGVTGSKIRSILVPLEYTRLDSLVDVMFATARDVEATVDSEKAVSVAETSEDGASGWEFTASSIIQASRNSIIHALGTRDGKRLLKRSRALYWDADHTYRVACTISKRYTKRAATPYWYAYHPTWNEFLSDGQAGWFALGCVDLSVAFAIPLHVIQQYLPQLNVTVGADGDQYWHVKLLEPRPGEFAMQLPSTGSSLPLAEYKLTLPLPAL